MRNNWGFQGAEPPDTRMILEIIVQIGLIIAWVNEQIRFSTNSLMIIVVDVVSGSGALSRKSSAWLNAMERWLESAQNFERLVGHLIFQYPVYTNIAQHIKIMENLVVRI